MNTFKKFKISIYTEISVYEKRILDHTCYAYNEFVKYNFQRLNNGYVAKKSGLFFVKCIQYIEIVWCGTYNDIYLKQFFLMKHGTYSVNLLVSYTPNLFEINYFISNSIFL